MASLKPFFYPRTVAVVGASREPDGIGHRILDSLRGSGFTGSIFPVNPHASAIAGLPAYASLTAIPEPVDLAVIVVPAEAVLGVIDDCGTMHIPAAILITAGFAETGDAGTALEYRIRDAAHRLGMRLIGPNCFGLMNLDPKIRLNATYTPAFPPAGRVAFASESGGMGLAVVTAAQRVQLGLSSFVSIGNHLDVSVLDLLEYWEQDPSTDVILLYLETIVQPQTFRFIAERVGRNKPIIAMKAGTTLAGQSAAGSHTAALATKETAVDALFAQCGVIRARSLDELLAFATGFSNQRRPRGSNVGILTNSGGPGVLCADRCAEEGLTVPRLAEAVQSALAIYLPPMAALRNPVDLIGFATEEEHARAVETMLTAGDIDSLIIVHVSVRTQDNPPVAAGIIRGIQAARQRHGTQKPVYVCWMAEGDLERTFIINEETIPTYRQPGLPPSIISRAVAYDSWARKPLETSPALSSLDVATAKNICTKALSTCGSSWLGTEETYALLAAIGLPLVPYAMASTADEALNAAREIGFPVAVKLASRRIVHKTDIAAVHLHLSHEADVREAYEAIRARLVQDRNLDAMEGVLVQSMVSTGIEVAVGMTRDPHFGALLAFGLGGIHIEVLGDVQFRLAPLSARDASDMIGAIKGYRLLMGVRGRPAADVNAIREVLLRMSALVEAVPEIAEMDLNPLFALSDAQGCRIVDARIRVT